MKDESVIAVSARLLRPFWPLALGATALGALSGVATAWLLSTINQAFHSPAPAGGLLVSFVGLVILVLLGEVVSDIGNAYVGQQVVAQLRQDLTDRVLAAPIGKIETFRIHRIIAALNQDVDVISSFTFAFSSIAIAVSVTLGCIVYLLVLSPVLFAIAATALILGMILSARARRRGVKGFELSRQTADELQRQYRTITDGAKELRINRQRRAFVHRDQLAAAINRMRDMQFRAMRNFMSANALSDAVFWSVIAILMGTITVLKVDGVVLSGFVLVLLYVKGPVDQIVGTLPLFARAQVSLRRVAELSREFANPEPHLLLDNDGAPGKTVSTIDLIDVRYGFHAAGAGTPFVLGPIDLSIGVGEILFIVGENGSGKTTLIKLVLGLYQPQDGQIRWDGSEVTAESRDDYRQLFSAIFFDYFLFDELVAPDGVEPAVVARHLERLEIAHKVRIENGRFSTIDLSTGQRKRLALVHAYLEGRPVMVFDEWAAEQDPTFRRLFYEQLLPDLKAQGKTLIVISHDDRYFHAADRLIRLQDGKIVDDIRMTPAKNGLSEVLHSDPARAFEAADIGRKSEP